MLCCPKCRSIEVYEDLGGYTGTIYRCKKCGYRGSFIVEIEDERNYTGDGKGSGPEKR